MPGLILETYGKAVIVKGDTREIKDFLKEKGGKWNKGQCGWIFPGSRRGQVLESLQGRGATVEDRTEGGAGGAPGDTGGAAAAAAPAAAKRKAPEATAAAAPAAAKKPKGAPDASVGAKETIIEVADKLRATISSFQDSLGVDIRKFYEDRASGELRPTAKGIRLKTEEWGALCKAVGQIDAAYASDEGRALQLTDDITVTIRSPSDRGGPKCVDIRRTYVDKSDGERKPSKKGVFLSQMEWGALKAVVGELTAALGGAGSGDAKAAARKPPSQKPAVSPAAAPQATSAGLRNQLVELLKGRDLTSVSLKTVRGELEASLSLPAGALDGQREEIKGIVADLLQGGAL